MTRKKTTEVSEDGSKLFVSETSHEPIPYEEVPTEPTDDWKVCALCHNHFQGDQSTHDAFQHR